MFSCNALLPAFGAKPPMEERPKLAAWWNHVQTRPSVKKGLRDAGSHGREAAAIGPHFDFHSLLALRN
jgi:hypothetical protein